MEKPYDVKALAKKLELAGLEGAEDLAEECWQCVKAWLKESAVASDMEWDDILMLMVDKLDALVLPAIDKINPHDNAPVEPPVEP